MKVVLASLPQHVFRSLSVEHQPDFFGTCARLQIAYGSQTNVARVARLLGRDEQTAEESFTHQCNKTLREGKTHAEIQLAYYLETHQPKPAPRVAASSKMTCSLCNMFLCQAAKVLQEAMIWKTVPCLELTCVFVTVQIGAPLRAKFGGLYPQ